MQSSPSSDRNLLFGILAVQMDFITRDALVGAMGAWVLDRSKTLGMILTERGDLDPSHRALLESLVEAHIRRHENDAQKSLAALSSVTPCERPSPRSPSPNSRPAWPPFGPTTAARFPPRAMPG